MHPFIARLMWSGWTTRVVLVNRRTQETYNVIGLTNNLMSKEPMLVVSSTKETVLGGVKLPKGTVSVCPGDTYHHEFDLEEK